MTRRRTPRPASDAIRDLADRLAPATTLAAVQRAWPEAAGEAFAAQSEPTGEAGGVVTVTCSSAVWAQELEWHLLVPISLFGAAYALRHGEHVRVDVLYAGFSERNKALVDVLSGVAGLVVSLLVIQLSWRYVGQSFAQDEGSANPGGIPYRYILKAFIPAGFALLALQFTAETLRSIARLKRA